MIRRRTSLTCTLLLVSLCCEFGRGETPVKYVGRAACATATCHGGIQGQGPSWNHALSAWETQDLAHRDAGKVLLNNQSRQIVANMLATSADPAAVTEADYAEFLMERCTSCHAPQANSGDTLEPEDWQRKIQAGVSCEDCHGQASSWLPLHTLEQWNGQTTAAHAAGFRDTQDWMKRIDNCARCHIGSRTADGLIRDMNHDMIAAGHPVLRFDMTLFQCNLPAHWHISNERVFESQASTESPVLRADVPTLHEYEIARLRTLELAATLSRERTSANPHVPQPEFAEFNCFACHQQLTVNSTASGTRQQLLWNLWYTADLPFEPLPQASVRTDIKSTIVKLQDRADAERKHVVNSGVSTPVTQDTVRAAFEKLGTVKESQWQRAVTRYWKARLTLLNSRTSLDQAEIEQLDRQLSDVGRSALPKAAGGATRPRPMIGQFDLQELQFSSPRSKPSLLSPSPSNSSQGTSSAGDLKESNVTSSITGNDAFPLDRRGVSEELWR